MGLGDIIGTTLGLLGLITSYYFYRRSRRAKEPCWDLLNNNLIRDYRAIVPELTVSYRNQPVESLSVANFIFWNRGQDTIERRHITHDDPLTLVAGGAAKLLSAQRIAATNETNQITLTIAPDGARALLDFVYLDHGQGAVFQIAHTGQARSDLTLRGTIMGVSHLHGRATKLNFRKYLMLSVGLSVSAVGALFLVSWLYYWALPSGLAWVKPAATAIIIGIPLVFLITLLVMLRNIGMGTIPKKLRVFWESVELSSFDDNLRDRL